MTKYNVILTGAGSVMGQSIFKALANSSYSNDMNIHVLNSVEIAAGFEFDKLLSESFNSITNHLCPFAKSDSYLEFINTLIIENDIDIIYPGTQHELDRLSSLNSPSSHIVACPDNITAKNCLDKANTTEILENNGISAPISIRVVGGKLDSWPKSYPVILKPNSSSASRNVFKCDSKAALESALDEYKNLDIVNAVAQTYLDGPEYTCGVYLDKYSNSINTISFERILSEDGASLYGEVIYNSEVESYLKSVVMAFIKDSQFKFGHLNVQLRLTENGPQLFEINGRLSSTEAPKSVLGFNSVEAYFSNIVLGKSYEEFSPKVGKKFIRFYEEIYF